MYGKSGGLTVGRRIRASAGRGERCAAGPLQQGAKGRVHLQ